MDDKRNIRARLKDGMWLESIPNFGKHFHDSDFLEQQNNSWDDVWVKVRQAENVMSCIIASMSNKENDIIKPVSLKEMTSFIDNLEKWVDDNSDFLTFPASKEGWTAAVENTLKNENMDTFTLLCGAFPDQIKMVISHENIPDGKIKKWWNSFNNIQVKEEAVKTQEVIKEQPIEKEVPAVENQPAKPVHYDNKKPFKKPEGPYPASEKVLNNIKSLESLKISIEKSSEGAGKLIDEYMMSNTHGKSNKEVTDWFSKVFFPSFQHMEEDQVNFFIDNIPVWKDRPLDRRPLKNVDIKEVLGEISFWSSLKFMQKKVSYTKNQEILKKFIPNLLDISNVNVGFDTRLELGKKMFDFTKKSEDLFKNRLLMWSAMGGSLTEQNNSEKVDMFQSKKDVSDSMVKWIKESNNPMWDKVVIEYAKEKDLNLYKWYPNDFKSDDLLEFYVSSAPVSKPPM